MSSIDLFFSFIILSFAFFGYWFGFLHTLGSLVGLVFAAFISSRYYAFAGAWLESMTGWGENISIVVMFIALFVLSNRLIGFLFWLINKIYKVISVLPFLKLANKLAGLIFGALQGVLTIGVVIYFIERVPLPETVMVSIAQSVIAPYCVETIGVLLPVLPEALKLLESSINYVEGVFVEISK